MRHDENSDRFVVSLDQQRGRIENNLWFLGFVVGFGSRPKRLGQVSIDGGKRWKLCAKRLLLRPSCSFGRSLLGNVSGARNHSEVPTKLG